MVTRTGIEPVLPPWKGGVLAAWPTSRIMVAEVGFEPTTIRVWTERSSQLSYSAMLTSVPKAFILYTIQSVLSIHLIETKLRTGKFFWGKIFLSKSLTNLIECCIIYCTRRCDGTGRRTGLKIHNAVSYHLGVNPWFYKAFWKLNMVLVFNVPPRCPSNFSGRTSGDDLKYEMPVCWNWQTRRTQNLLRRFIPPFRKPLILQGFLKTEYVTCF